MKTGMRWAGIIACVLFGLAGLGIIIGELWMSDTLGRVRDAKPPSVRFVESVNGSWQRCAGPSRAPTTMAAIEEAIAASSRADLRQAVLDQYECLAEDDRTAFVRVLRDAAANGNRIAFAALQTIARDGCATLLRMGGGDPPSPGATSFAEVATEAESEGRSDAALDANIEHCVAALPSPDGSIEEPEGAVGSPLRTARFAQLLALLERGNPAPSATAAFCDDANALDSGVLARFMRQHPNLPELLQQTCGVVPSSPPPTPNDPAATGAPESGTSDTNAPDAPQ